MCFALSWCIRRGEKMEGHMAMALICKEDWRGSQRRVNVVGSGFVERCVGKEAGWGPHYRLSSCSYSVMSHGGVFFLACMMLGKPTWKDRCA